jgi:hypothetical protein
MKIWKNEVCDEEGAWVYMEIFKRLCAYSLLMLVITAAFALHYDISDGFEQKLLLGLVTVAVLFIRLVWPWKRPYTLPDNYHYGMDLKRKKDGTVDKRYK